MGLQGGFVVLENPPTPPIPVRTCPYVALFYSLLFAEAV